MRVREAASRASCANNLKQLALAVRLYNDASQRLPPGEIGPYQSRIPNQPYYGWGPSSYGWSWLSRVLPFVEQENLFQTGGIPNQTLSQSGIAANHIALFLCPSDNAFNALPRTDAGDLIGFPVVNTNYKGVSGANWGYDYSQNLWFPTLWKNAGTNGSYDGLNRGDGAMFRTDILTPRCLLDITDGLSNTFLIRFRRRLRAFRHQRHRPQSVPRLGHHSRRRSRGFVSIQLNTLGDETAQTVIADCLAERLK